MKVTETPVAKVQRIYGANRVLPSQISRSRFRSLTSLYSYIVLISEYGRVFLESVFVIIKQIWLKYFKDDPNIRIVGGLSCLDFQKDNSTVQRADLGKNMVMRLEDLWNGLLIKGTSEVLQELSMTYVQMPRDILNLYSEKDPDVIRKMELFYSVRIFWGRDFEKFRDQDRPSAPRGKTSLCIYGLHKDIMEAKREFLGWLEFQADHKEEEMLVPEEAAGNVIGRQGKRVAEIQAKSQARVDVQTHDRDGELVKVTITGRRPARTLAKFLIQECVDHSRRMRENDRVRDAIRVVRQRVMYGEDDDDDFEGNFNEPAEQRSDAKFTSDGHHIWGPIPQEEPTDNAGGWGC